MNIKLLGERVLVELQKTESKTSSGLIISKEAAPNDTQIGIVIKVGSGKKTDNGEVIKSELKEGDKVMYNYGTLLLLEGKSYFLVNEADVIMVL